MISHNKTVEQRVQGIFKTLLNFEKNPNECFILKGRYGGNGSYLTYNKVFK